MNYQLRDIKNTTVQSEQFQNEINQVMEADCGFFFPSRFNDGISQDFPSVLYICISGPSVIPILSAGRGAFLVKADNKEAYRCSQFTLMISPYREYSWEE